MHMQRGVTAAICESGLTGRCKDTSYSTQGTIVKIQNRRYLSAENIGAKKFQIRMIPDIRTILFGQRETSIT